MSSVSDPVVKSYLLSKCVDKCHAESGTQQTDITSVSVAKLNILVSCLQAKDMATFIQTKKDMGCRATQVLTIEEAANPQAAEAQQFWTVLGGQTAYQRKT